MPSSDQPVIFLGMPAIIRSEAMRKLMDTVERVASSDATVLITGETGTGKELISRAIHHHSLRCHQPWVDVNCATLPEHLVESELFGHEKGAFSGADSLKPGLFELAHKGTLFLDEIGELEPKLQVKLLRILDGVPYYRVGGRKKVAVDVRVVAATNREMSNEVGAGQFREDLYHRLSQIHVQLPPLRERLDDILPLAEFFLYEQDTQVKLSAEAKKALCRHAWPGNIRELRNVVLRGVRDKKVMICGFPFFACESLRSDTLGKEAYYARISRRARTSTKGHPRSDSRSRRLPQRIHQRCQRPLRQTVLPLPSARPARSWPELPPDQEGQRQDRE